MQRTVKVRSILRYRPAAGQGLAGCGQTRCTDKTSSVYQLKNRSRIGRFVIEPPTSEKRNRPFIRLTFISLVVRVRFVE